MYLKEFLKLGLVFLAGILIQYFFIKLFNRFKIFQKIRPEGPQSHFQKSATPAFGGLGLALTLLFGTFLFQFNDFSFKFLVASALLFGFIGFLDDLILFFGWGKRGLTGREKIFLQIIVAGFLALILIGQGHFTSMAGSVYFLKFNSAWAYFFLAVLLFVATVNSVNLTDGLDGLATGVSLPIFLAFIGFSLSAGDFGAFIFSLIFIFTLFSFLVFNFPPAKIFMGDAGANLIGGAMAGTALLLHQEFLLILLGGVLVAEALSVILQVASFKLFKTRIFKMSPLHHHFELLGWAENQVVFAFWTVSAILATTAIILR